MIAITTFAQAMPFEYIQVTAAPKEFVVAEHTPPTPPPAPEEWRPMFGYERDYEVSSHGRVRSLRHHAGPRRNPRFLKQYKNPNDKYLRIRPRQRTQLAHRLVAASFLGPAPADRPEVHHRDGNRSMNHIDNLEYVSRRGNQKAAAAMGRFRNRELLTPTEVRAIRQMLGSTTQVEIARRFNVQPHVISAIARGKTYQHVLPVYPTPPPHLVRVVQPS